VIEDVTERKKAEERLLHDAFFDGLTGLPNRALLLDRLDRVIARSKRREDYHCAVLFMDLDRFKVVNDSLGHSVGDKLLISVAGRLHECLRSEDTVARLGGDEFVVLLEDLKELSQATSIADRIREELSRPHDLNGQKVFTSGSIGIVMTVQGYNQPADVLRDADIAMYGAKLAGKDRYQIFDPAMRELALTRMQLEVELRQALAREELRVHFQPILEMDSGKPFGFEALIRWEHPQRGIISPAEFLPILEETGLIIQAGRWVMKEACKTARQWNRKHSDLEPLTISVNLSGREFTHPELEDSLKEALEESELDPACLTVEITESVIMSDPEQARHVLQRLGSLGLQIHLDDFGTGYSSLGKLGQFHIDKLKIDRTFIRQIEGKRGEAAIVEAILQLARNLAMGVIAEGVETQQQFNYLREKGCPYYQGYYIAEPMSKPEAEAFIRAKKKELKRNKGR
jgi:diguanylate cyclase (GGDEF)-like protein